MANYVVDINVLRDNQWTTRSSKRLFPGDVVEVPTNGFKAPCDMVLVRGSAIVDESSLTGESLPVVKRKVPDDPSKFTPPKKTKITPFFPVLPFLPHFHLTEKITYLKNKIGIPIRIQNLIPIRKLRK